MVGKYLDICTSHLTSYTIDNLVMENIKGVYTYDYPEGMFIVVPDMFDIEEELIPSDLDTLFKYAKANGITLIRLDRDGEEVDDLPIYNWDGNEVSTNEE